jgi:hypothetical protein
MRSGAAAVLFGILVITIGGIVAWAQTPTPPARVVVAGLGAVTTTVGFGKGNANFRPEPSFPFPPSRSSFARDDAIYSYLVVEHPRLVANTQITVSIRWLRGEIEVHRYSQSYTGVAGYSSQWAWNGLPSQKTSPGSYAAEWSINGTIVGRGGFAVAAQ